MAVIGKIRKRSGLLIIIIGVALAGFVLQDLFSNRGGRGNVDFGKIGDEKVSKMEFDVKLEEQLQYYRQQTGNENLSSAETFQIMTMTWDQMVKELIMQSQYEELGLAIDHGKGSKPSISPEELYELILGNNLHPYIVQNFTDPATGMPNRQQIQYIVQNFSELNDEDKNQWKNLEQAVKDDRLSTKYNTLLNQSYYLPGPFAKRTYEENNTVAKFRYFGIKYASISDSAVSITDEDYQKYYEAHKHEFDQEDSRDMEYVIWDVVASDEDKKKIAEDVSRIFEEFTKVASDDMENFVNANSDARYDSTFYKKGELPVQIDSIMFSSPVGTTVEPYIENNVYVMSRLMQVQLRPDSIKVSHILIGYKDAPAAQPSYTRSKDQAKFIADSLLFALRQNNMQFAAVAAAKSDFPTAKEDGGDLKWFADGNVNFKFFFDSLMFNKVGDMKVIQSNMGYHVVYLTGKLEPVKKVKVAMLQREIKPSSQTYNDYFAMASEFAGSNRNQEQFNKSVVEKGLSKRSAQFVQKMDNNLPGLEYSREIIRWAFDEKTEKGTVSQSVFDAQGKYVVAVVTEKREKGIATLEQVKPFIESLVKREKKAEILLEKVKAAMSSTKDLYQLASKLNTIPDTLDYLTFSSANFPNFGPEPEVIGTLFTLKKNVMSEPLKGKMAVYVIVVDDFVSAPATTNYAAIQVQAAGNYKQRATGDAFNAMKKKTKIVDNRHFYY
jgi:peptidyl-prolyl cis-trans isomerase D